MRGMLQRRGTCSPSPERLRVVREMQPVLPGAPSTAGATGKAS